MNLENLQNNMMEQVKEAQLKLGFTREIIRLYYPVQSLRQLLGVERADAQELAAQLNREAPGHITLPGEFRFTACKGERIEVQVPQEAVAYIHENYADPPFLKGIIELFGHGSAHTDHELTIDRICDFFKSFHTNYVCHKMQPESDFDYVLYFPDGVPDAWYYCIKFEMQHVIYHRFTKEDYEAFHML